MQLLLENIAIVLVVYHNWDLIRAKVVIAYGPQFFSQKAES